MHRHRWILGALTAVTLSCLSALGWGQGRGAALYYSLERTELSSGAVAHKYSKNITPDHHENTVPVSSNPLAVTSSEVTFRFDGMDYSDNKAENSGFAFIPPDPMVAAGNLQIIGVVNKMIESRGKTGTLNWRQGLRDFFSTLAFSNPPTLGTFPFDPKIIYDQYEDRFVVVALEETDVGDGDPSDESRILIAVSTTGTPATPFPVDWFFVAIDSKINFGNIPAHTDYPGLEVDEEAVYLTNNMFAFSANGGTHVGSLLWIIDKGIPGGLYDGGPISFTIRDPFFESGIPSLFGTAMPAQVWGAGGVGPGIGTYLVQYSGITSGSNEFLNVMRVDDPLGNAGGPNFTQEFVSLGNIEDFFGSLPDAPQLGGSALIEVNDRRALDAVWRDGYLWMTTTIGPRSGPDFGQATAHWVKLDATAVTSAASGAGLITLDQQGDIGGEDIAPQTSTFFPSLAVNAAGEAKFGFSASAPTIFGGAYVGGRQPGDPPGTLQPTEVVRAGVDYYLRTFSSDPMARNRWGDYSGISVDPSDDRVFWVYNEFANQRGPIPDIYGHDGEWGTGYASCGFSCVQISCPSEYGIPPGATDSISVCIKNCGISSETFHFTVSDDSLWCSTVVDSVTLDPGDSTCIMILCVVPEEADCDDVNPITITATPVIGQGTQCTTMMTVNCPVLVRLAMSSISRTANGALLQWRLDPTQMPSGFHVHRERGNGSRIQLTRQPLAVDHEFQYLDRLAPTGRTSYWLEEITLSGQSLWHGPLVLESRFLQAGTVSLAPTQPNPFHERTSFSYTLPKHGQVSIRIYDAQGRLITSILDGPQNAGTHSVSWDGSTGRGSRAGVGIYVLELRALGQTRTQKLILSR